MRDRSRDGPGATGGTAESTPAPGAGWIERIESHGGTAAWVLLLLGWILARNLLESVLEPGYQLGFDWRGEISFGMFFLHFPLFYLTLFAGLLLWFHLWTGKPLSRIARVLARGFALLLIAPLIDLLVSHGRGFALRYLLGLSSDLWRFWDPRAGLEIVSPGQRLEILAGCVLAGIYGWSSLRRPPSRTARGGGWRGLLGALLGAGGLFLIAAFLGSWPSLLAELARTAGESLPEAYERIFQLGGLIPSESRRHALALLVLLLPFAVVLLWRADRARFRVIAGQLSWTRLLHYTGLAPAGAVLAHLVYREHLPIAFRNPIDWIGAGVLWVAFVAAFLAARLWNDGSDLAADRINEPSRPLVRGVLTAEETRRWASISAAAALSLALCVGYHHLLLMLGCLLLAGAYSVPPLRLKRWPLVATFSLALLSLISLWSGFALVAQEMAPRVFPHRLSLFVLLGVTLGFQAKDLKDCRGDRATGVHTLPTLLGERWGRRVIAALVALSLALAWPILPLGTGFGLLSLLAGLIGALVTLRRRRPDGALLVLLLAFVLLLLLFVGQRPTLLREAAPEPLRRLHARTRALEMRARLHTLEPPERAAIGDPVGLADQTARLWHAAFDDGHRLTMETAPDRGAQRAMVWRERLLALRGETLY
ncbi:MAG: hypothetical protein GF330_11290, partial [Candidatus Eisenbacteria bacterium]|nr:hypothetical protein [Candidatus Eisenbacteria bacterium]